MRSLTNVILLYILVVAWAVEQVPFASNNPEDTLNRAHYHFKRPIQKVAIIGAGVGCVRYDVKVSF